MSGNVFNKEINTESLVISSKEVGLEVNYDKAKKIVNYLDVTDEAVTIMKPDNSSLEMVEEFRYVGILLTNQNSIQLGIKCRLNRKMPAFIR